MKKETQLTKSLKIVIKFLEKDFMQCKMSGKSHWPNIDCASCRGGIIFSCLENYLDEIKYEDKTKNKNK